MESEPLTLARVTALLFSLGRISSQQLEASRFSPVLLCPYQILIPSVVSVILALAFLRVRHMNNKASARRKPKHVKTTCLHILRLTTLAVRVFLNPA